MLWRMNQMKNMEHMAAGLAHDFNNMLQGVVGALDIMQKRIGQGRVDEIADLVETALVLLRRTAALTHSLLAFCRPEAVEMNRLCANEVIQSMESLLRCTVGDQMEVKLELGKGLPPIACDRHQLENALLNLVVNARDAMPHGGDVVVRTSCGDQAMKEADSARQCIGIIVADTGVGMTPDVVEHAFDPFYTTKCKGRGSGLGLAMVKCFVDRLGGQLALKSVVGKGTKITLYLALIPQR